MELLLLAWNLHRDKRLSRNDSEKRRFAAEYRWQREEIAFSDQSALSFVTIPSVDSTSLNAETIESWKISLINRNKSRETLSRLCVNMRALPCVFRKFTSEKSNVKPPIYFIRALSTIIASNKRGSLPFHIHVRFSPLYRENKSGHFRLWPTFPASNEKGMRLWCLSFRHLGQKEANVIDTRILCFMSLSGLHSDFRYSRKNVSFLLISRYGFKESTDRDSNYRPCNIILYCKYNICVSFV